MSPLRIYRSASLESAETDSSSTKLLEKSNCDYGEAENGRSPGFKSKNKTSRRWIIAHIFTLTLYTTVLIAALLKVYAFPTPKALPALQNPNEMLYSPMRDAIRYEVRTVHESVDNSSVFRGPPSPEVDEAWTSLFRYGDMLISEEELNLLNRTSIQVSDGSGKYLATPDTYHQLHCLWWLYQFAHPEAYTLKPTKHITVIDHVDHCLDLMRKWIQCHASASMMTYQWMPDTRIPWGNFEVDSVCVDWEHYSNWVTERAVKDPRAEGVFVHPVFGPSYPNEKD
ncbi:hypothetical protein B0O99DRAFT_621302 [Bisporella sp. PMI_857]|nr:hypothetical protein B0O99DRAFT_621302 [Bisporella sp. PMI_857]